MRGNGKLRRMAATQKRTKTGTDKLRQDTEVACFFVFSSLSSNGKEKKKRGKKVILIVTEKELAWAIRDRIQKTKAWRKMQLEKDGK